MSNDRFPLGACVLSAAIALLPACAPAPEPLREPVETTAAESSADPLLTADTALAGALAAADAATALSLLDDDASWTDATGRTLSKVDMTQSFPTPAITDENLAAVRRFEYGQVGVVQVDQDRLHGLRVWVQRPAGWRLLVYHEVQALPAPPTRTPGTGKDCVNPCRVVPYEPATENQRGVIAAFQALETASHAADVENWGTHVADEFILVSSNGDRAMTKAERIEGLRRSTFGGISPTELLSAQLSEFGDVVVMRARHRPVNGAPLQVTRVWVKRDGIWQSTLSYQTSIQGATADR